MRNLRQKQEREWSVMDRDSRLLSRAIFRAAREVKDPKTDRHRAMIRPYITGKPSGGYQSMLDVIHEAAQKMALRRSGFREAA